MKTYLNINTGVLSLIVGGTTPIRRLDAKRGDWLELEVVPSAVLPDGATGLLVAKPKGNYAAAPVALDATWAAPTEAGAGYLFALSLNTTELNALFAGAVAEITLMAEITWSAAGKVRSTQTFDLVVSRDVWVGDEGVPTDAEPEYPTSSEIHAALASVDALLAAVTQPQPIAPLSLFVGGTAGAWYDASDYSSLFQDVSGTVAVTTVAQPVRLMRDKSGNGHHISFAGTNPPLTGLDALGIRIITPVNATSRGVNATLSMAQPVTACVVYNHISTSEGLVYDSYNNNGGMYFRADGANIIIAENLLGIAVSVGNGVAAYILTHDSTLSEIWRDGQSIGSGNVGTNGLSGISLFNLRGNPNVIAGGFQSIRPFYGLILVGANLLTATKTKITAYLRNAANLNSGIGFALGDSTIGAYLGTNPVTFYVATQLAKVSLAVPGHTIAQQSTTWGNTIDRHRAKWVVIQIGLNDLDPAEAASVAITRLQSLVASVRAAIPSTGRIYVSKMIPCRARLIALLGAINGPIAQQKWVDMNEAIAGNGATPITGVSRRIIAHVPLLADGAGNLAAAYNTGDGIHPNNAGREIVAIEWMRILSSDEVL